MDDAKLNEYLNEMVSRVMEDNIDTISEAFWSGGAIKIDFDDGKVVTKFIRPADMWRSAALDELGKLDGELPEDGGKS